MSLFGGDLVIFHDDPFLLEDSSVSQIASPPRGLSHLPVEFRLPNCPHKLTKTADPWLGGGAAFGRLRTARGRHVGCSSLPPLRVSRGSRRAARGRPAWRAAFAA